MEEGEPPMCMLELSVIWPCCRIPATRCCEVWNSDIGASLDPSPRTVRSSSCCARPADGMLSSKGRLFLLPGGEAKRVGAGVSGGNMTAVGAAPPLSICWPSPDKPAAPPVLDPSADDSGPETETPLPLAGPVASTPSIEAR